jgi:hypothetical protein
MRVTIRTEGQRQLLACGATAANIARACEVAPVTVTDWRHGYRIPGPEARRVLFETIGIDPRDWARVPVGPAPMTPPQGPGVACDPNVTFTDPGSVAPPAPPADIPPLPPPLPSVIPPTPTPTPTNGGTNGNGHAAPSSLANTAALLASIQAQLDQPDLLPGDRVRITDSYTRTLALQARLQRDVDLLEDRIVREHPMWVRIKVTIGRVLARYPQIADEVCAELDRIGV